MRTSKAVLCLLGNKIQNCLQAFREKGMMKPGVIGRRAVACGCHQQSLSVWGVSGAIQSGRWAGLLMASLHTEARS